MSTLSSVEGMAAYVNPQALGFEQATGRAGRLAQALEVSNVTFNSALPEPKLIQDSLAGKTLIYSGGGDGTVNIVVESLIGLVRDDPEASANNLDLHAALMSDLLYVAGADGTANNFPLSALGKLYAREPALLVGDPAVRVGYHRPLVYQITEQNGDIVRLGVATNCIGLGGSAEAATRLEAAKPELRQHPKTRLLSEALIAFNGITETAPFELAERRDLGNTRVWKDHDGIIGYELVGSRVYAKEGRTSVNIDDTRFQPAVLRAHPSSAGQRAAVLTTMLGVKFSQYRQKPIELTDGDSVAVQLISEEPVAMHADGETGERYTLEPGQTLRVALSQLAVPIIMAR